MSDLPKLLAVDDGVLMRHALEMGFGARGFEVITAKDGSEALIQFKKYKGDFAAVLTDKDMPIMDGIALVKELRRLKFNGIVVLMSGILSDADKEQCQRYVTGFILKPFEVGELASILLGQGD